jgi:very-short-patch-repair endonuclease
VRYVDDKYRGERHPRALAELAQHQHGLVTSDQLVAQGFTRRMIDWRVSTGELHVVHRGVYAGGYVQRTNESRYMAAVLACGECAVLSHRSAAALVRICPHHMVVDVTVPGRRRGRPGINVHRTRHLPERDVTTVRGIPVTSLRRTLIDLADVVTPDAFQKALRSAENLYDFDRRTLRSIHGRRRLPLGHQLTRSDAERLLQQLAEQAGLPAPVMNGVIAGMEVDAHWPDQRVAVEIDGYAYHRTRSQLQRDDRKATALAIAGYTLLRFTYADLQDDPAYVIASLRSVL